MDEKYNELMAIDCYRYAKKWLFVQYEQASTLCRCRRNS